MHKIIYLLGLITLALITSCEQETGSETPGPDNINITGRWEVNAYIDSTFVFGPFRVMTRKVTSAGNDSIIIQDEADQFWKFRIKALADEKQGTFQTKLSNCEMSEDSIGVKIPIGKIIRSDSIYFEIQFEDDITPYGNIYQLKGHRTI